MGKTMDPEFFFVQVLHPARQDPPENLIRFIRSHPEATWFHVQQVNGCFPRCRRFSPVVFMARQRESVIGAIAGVRMRHRSKRLPFSYITRLQVNGCPLIDPGVHRREQVLSGLLEKIKNYAADDNAEVEVRNYTCSSRDQETLIAHGFGHISCLNLVKTVSTPDQLWMDLKSNRRRQIRRASQNGTIVRSAGSEAEVRDFYAILTDLYKRKVKKQKPPLVFFLDFFRTIQQQGKGIILLAFKGKTVIGGIVCPIHDRQTMYEWYVCGQDREFPEHHPSVMLTWHALLYASGKGIRNFDFMGIGKSGIPYGVRDFKLRFGGEVIEYGRYILPSQITTKSQRSPRRTMP